MSGSIRPDSVVMSSLMPSYMGIATYTGSFTISGTVSASGGVKTFSTSIPISRSNSRFDVYATNLADNFKQLANNTNFSSVYEFSGNGEICSPFLKYTSTSITYGLFITNNTASSITLTTQTFQISVVEYREPY